MKAVLMTLLFASKSFVQFACSADVTVCDQDDWFLGLTGDSAVTFTVMDVCLTCDSVAVGGGSSTLDAETANIIVKNMNSGLIENSLELNASNSDFIPTGVIDIHFTADITGVEKTLYAVIETQSTEMRLLVFRGDYSKGPLAYILKMSGLSIDQSSVLIAKNSIEKSG